MPKAWHANVCFGSKADIAARLDDVRFTPKSGHWNSVAKCPLCAKSGPSAMQRKRVLFDRRLGEPEATELLRRPREKSRRFRYQPGIKSAFGKSSFNATEPKLLGEQRLKGDPQ